MKRKPLTFEVVTTDEGRIAVKTQIRKNGHWYTACEIWCIPSRFNAGELATIISEYLNDREKNS